MVGRRGSRVPERWTDYIPLGRRMPGTRFIAFKVPLKESFELNLDPEERFSPRDLIKKINEQKEELGLVIDLTHTTRYYGPEELPATLFYSKILTMGHEIPNKDTVFRFRCVVKQFLRDNKDNDKLIGVHCTHGLNRTGYMVCRYLIDVEGMEPNAAIELFNRARGHPIERTNYIEDLQKRSLLGKSGRCTDHCDADGQTSPTSIGPGPSGDAQLQEEPEARSLDTDTAPSTAQGKENPVPRKRRRRRRKPVTA